MAVVKRGAIVVHALLSTAETYIKVKVTVHMPGRFATERTTFLDEMDAAERGVDPAVIVAESQREIPVGRYGTPEEFGEVVAFLASGAASYVNGIALPIDGGLSRSMV